MYVHIKGIRFPLFYIFVNWIQLNCSENVIIFLNFITTNLASTIAMFKCAYIVVITTANSNKEEIVENNDFLLINDN